MAKKLISVWLSLTILLFSSISIYADENVQGDFFNKNIVINGETIVNNHLQFPFFLYKDATYFPLTPEMGEILGLKAEMNFESRTLKLLKTEPSLVNISESWKKNEKEDVLTQVFSGTQVLAYELEPQSLEEIAQDEASTDDPTDISQTTEGSISDEVIDIPELSVREIDLAGLPVLTRGDIIYLPIKAMTGENGLGWDVYYDSYTGIYVSTKEGTPAKSFWNEAESKYNKGLVSYIQKYNGSYTVSKAQELVFMFKNAAKTYHIDEKILMAVAHKESTFNAKSGEKGGAAGMMQVMPSTGARYGLSVEQLLDAETSINFGAMYLSERIAAYGGDLTKGFSAYNQGSVAVNRGSFSTRYANRVIGTINGINSYLTSNGYGLGY
ncbi:MAG TPA: lytic transglycosylase domain-containing protein [Anaerovoracaceae bacterium]|nr:lytic transglycosylase domain-containing protein [Anaerovoracaceae bacterium]